jgi:hypothetical protein
VIKLKWILQPGIGRNSIRYVYFIHYTHTRHIQSQICNVDILYGKSAPFQCYFLFFPFFIRHGHAGRMVPPLAFSAFNLKYILNHIRLGFLEKKMLIVYLISNVSQSQSRIHWRGDFTVLLCVFKNVNLNYPFCVSLLSSGILLAATGTMVCFTED